MSGTGASKLPEKTERKTVNVVGHDGEGHVKKATATGAEFAEGRTMEDVGNRDLNVIGKKGGSADEVTAVGMKFN